jgi:3-oxoacyl-[acyl-carrier-protein] synthase II
VLGQGPKFASPAEFPQLIASTGSGNASIYLGLSGPCLSVSAFEGSGESAVSVAISLIEQGLGTSLLAGAAEAHDAIVDAVLGDARGVRRGEGGGFVVLEALPGALERGHLPLAIVAEQRSIPGVAAAEFAALAPPPDAACVVTGCLPPSVLAGLAGSTWRGAKRFDLLERLGFHEAIGAVALAVAVAEVAAGGAEQALVVNADLDRVYITRLERYRGSA